MKEGKYRFLQRLVIKFSVRFCVMCEQCRCAATLERAKVFAARPWINAENTTDQALAEAPPTRQRDRGAIAFRQATIIQVMEQYPDIGNVADLVAQYLGIDFVLK